MLGMIALASSVFLPQMKSGNVFAEIKQVNFKRKLCNLDRYKRIWKEAYRHNRSAIKEQRAFRGCFNAVR